MAQRVSAGLLMYRRRDDEIQVLLVHPGGPFWRNKDEGAWSIPKGEQIEDEDLLATARREFEEELGTKPPDQFRPLAPIRQKAGKLVHAWAVEGDLDTSSIKSNAVTIEWPPKSGKRAQFPEVDRVEFFEIKTARRKINSAQVAFLDELEAMLSPHPPKSQ